MEHFLIFLWGAIWLLGLFALVLTITSVIKGAAYIGCASKLSVGFERPISCSRARWALFRATPFAILVLFAWAGASVIRDLGWVFGDLGFRDHDGQWTKYRDHFSITCGGILGLLFSQWLTIHCQTIWEQTVRAEGVSLHDWLEKHL